MKEKSLKMSLLSIFCIIAVVSLFSLGSSVTLSLMQEWQLSDGYRAILGPHPWQSICLSQHAFPQITEVWKYFQFSVLGRNYQWIRLGTIWNLFVISDLGKRWRAWDLRIALLLSISLKLPGLCKINLKSFL